MRNHKIELGIDIGLMMEKLLIPNRFSWLIFGQMVLMKGVIQINIENLENEINYILDMIVRWQDEFNPIQFL